MKQLDEATLRREYLDRTRSIMTISKATGVPYETIRQQLIAAGIRRRASGEFLGLSTALRDAFIRAEHRAGKTQTELARRFGVTRQRINAVVRQPARFSALVTRTEAEDLLGYAPGSLKAMMTTDRDGRWPPPAMPGAGPQGAHLYRLGDLRAVADNTLRPQLTRRTSKRATLPDTDETIECLECGRRLRSLGPHLRSHGITAEEYRRAHQLPATAALMARPTRERMHEVGKERGEEAAQHLRQDRQQELAERAAEVRAVTSQYDLVREARAAGGRRAQQTHAEKRDAKARWLGFRGWAEAINETRGLSISRVSSMLGVSPSTVYRWRTLIPPPDDDE